MTMSATDLASVPDKLIEYGVATAVLYVVVRMLTVPTNRVMLKTFGDGQDAIRESLNLLRQSVESQRKATEAFARFEHDEDAVHGQLMRVQEQILETQREILKLLRAIHANHRPPDQQRQEVTR